MDVTPMLRTRLRRLLNESIPPGGTEANTRFADHDIDMLLIDAASMNSAAAAGWREKAGLLQGDIESYSIGSEKYDMTSLKDLLNQALAMAKQYDTAAAEATAKASYGSFILGVNPPPVL